MIRDGNFLAVVATKEFQAVKAMERLAASAKWSERETMPDQAGFADWLKGQDKRAIPIRDEKGAVNAAVKSLDAEYFRPYHMHGSIGPSCGVAEFKDGDMTVWACSQGMFPLRAAIAELTKLPPAKVRCIHLEGSGCYGHNGADDAAADAAYIAFKMPGAPIRVQWMRHDEHLWEPYGAAMVMRVKAAIDGTGMLAGWDYEVFTDAHSTRPGGAGSTLVGQSIENGFKLPAPQPIPQPNGSGDRNIIPPYKVANLRLIHNFQPHMKLRASALRGLGAYANVFAIESAIDELAAMAGEDPVAFRLKHLAHDSRASDCLKLAAEKFGWKAGAVAGRGTGRGQGVAYSRYKSLAGYCAVAVEVEVEQETGRVRLVRAVSAADSGTAVNPDGIKNQIEGGIIQAASWTIHEFVALRPYACPLARLEPLPDPALLRNLREHRGARDRPARHAISGDRRGEPGSDRRGNSQRDLPRHRPAPAGAPLHRAARQGGDRSLEGQWPRLRLLHSAEGCGTPALPGNVNVSCVSGSSGMSYRSGRSTRRLSRVSVSIAMTWWAGTLVHALIVGCLNPSALASLPTPPAAAIAAARPASRFCWLGGIGAIGVTMSLFMAIHAAAQGQNQKRTIKKIRRML